MYVYPSFPIGEKGGGWNLNLVPNHCLRICFITQIANSVNLDLTVS